MGNILVNRLLPTSARINIVFLFSRFRLTEITPLDTSFEELETDDQCVKCHVCEKVFMFQYQRTEHIKHVHSSLSKKKICLCEFCGNVFSSTSTMFRHQRQNHTGSPKHRCEFPNCNKVFPEHEPYVSHVSSHFDIKHFSCEHCKVTFRYKQNLARHQREKCQQKQKHICDYCVKEFSTKDSLHDHQKGKHSGFCYTCGCGKSYKWRSSLSYHRKKCNS